MRKDILYSIDNSFYRLVTDGYSDCGVFFVLRKKKPSRRDQDSIACKGLSENYRVSSWWKPNPKIKTADWQFELKGLFRLGYPRILVRYPW
jgi:hypothetical protein